MNANLYALLQAHFPQDRSKIALESASDAIYSYAKLEELTARYAGFIAALGVVPGDRIAVQVEKSPEALCLYLACLQSGAVFLPLNSAYQAAEVDYFLGDASPTVVVHQTRSEEWMAPLCDKYEIAHRFTLRDDNRVHIQQGRHSWHENASKSLPMLETAHRDTGDLAAILYTSGTTGRSKGAMITHRNLSSNAVTLHAYWGFKPGDVLLHTLPIYHVHGLFVACHTALLNGSKLIFHSKFEAKTVIAALPHATIFMGVPTMYVRLLAEPTFAKKTCASTRLFISGSAPLLAETFHAFFERTGCVILERYGMTETGMITSNPLQGERRGGTVGLPLPGVALRVTDEAGRACVAGDIGDLQVKGENVLPGYWQMPDKNKEEFTADGYFKTGDVGNIDADGYVTIVGRSKDLVISGGYNVYPKEIEMLLDEIAGVAESAVIGLPHPDFGEAVAAVIVKKPAAALVEADVVGSLKGKIAAFKLPKRVFVVEDLPRNAMGKVQKNELRKRYADTFK